MKYIFVQPLGGLCNRMRAIAGAVSLSKRLNKQLIVIWTRDNSLNARFSEIFESITYKVIDIPLGSFTYKFLYHLCKDILQYEFLDDEWINNNARGIDYDRWKDKVQGKNLFIYADRDIFYDEDYSIFKANQKLLDQYNTICYDSSMIGIHIRRTDNEQAIRKSPTALFINQIKQEIQDNPVATFYLATDDPKEENLFINNFGNKIKIYKKRSLDRNDPVAIIDAMIDLYNLSHCQKIYGSFCSSFSDIAAVWGGINKTILKLEES